MAEDGSTSCPAASSDGQGALQRVNGADFAARITEAFGQPRLERGDVGILAVIGVDLEAVAEAIVDGERERPRQTPVRDFIREQARIGERQAAAGERVVDRHRRGVEDEAPVEPDRLKAKTAGEQIPLVSARTSLVADLEKIMGGEERLD